VITAPSSRFANHLNTIVLSEFNRAKLGYIVPILLRGRTKKDKKSPPIGLRALFKKKNGYYW